MRLRTGIYRAIEPRANSCIGSNIARWTAIGMLVHNSRAFPLDALPQADTMSKTPPSADDYRKRAAANRQAARAQGRKEIRSRAGAPEAQALLDLADNEDWLAGKSKEKPKK